MITINPTSQDVITINISDADQVLLNTSSIVLLEDAATLEGENGAYYLERANHTGTQAANTITGLAVVATSGSYNDLSNKPTISTNAETLGGQDGAYYLSRANHTGTQAISTVSGLQAALDDKLESVAWGGITGTLSDQTDLQDALDTLTDTDIDLQDALNLKLNIADYNDRFLGLFSSVFDLVAAHPTASAGDYAQVDFGIGMDVIVYAWDVSDAQWIPVGSSPIANTDALPEGSSNLYHTSQRVRDTPLTGLSTATATPITAADSVLSAAGKLQGQASANATAIAGKLNTADAPAAVRGTALTGLSLATATPITATDTVLSAAGKLQAQVSAASVFPKFKSGVWCNQHMTYTSESQSFAGSNFGLFVAPQSITIANLALEFSSSAADRRARIRFYTEAGVSVSGVFDFDAAVISAKTAITPLTLPAGRYLIGVAHSGTGTASNLSSINALNCEPILGVIGGVRFGSNTIGYKSSESFATSLAADISGALPFLTKVVVQPAVFMLIV